MTAPILALAPAWGPIRQMVEDAALALLQPLHKICGGYLETLEPYNGELDSEDGLDRLVRQALAGAPLVMVGAQESTFSRGGTAKRQWREDLQIELVIASSSLRGLAARRRSGPEAGPQTDAAEVPTADPGVYRVLEDIRRRLLGPRLWIDGADSAELVREQPIFTVERMTVWRAMYRIGVAFTATYDRPEAAPAQAVRVDHHLADAGGANPLASTES